MKKVFLAIFFLCLCNLFVFGMGEQEENYGSTSYSEPSFSILDILPIFTIAFIVCFVVMYKKNKKKQIVCPKCEQAIEGFAKFCTKCGNDLTEENKKKKIGKAIASYVLGFVGFIFSLSSFSFTFTFFSDDNKFVNIMSLSAMSIWVLLFIIPSLILGINSWRKQKQLFAKAGIGLCVLSIIPILIGIIKILI